MEQKLIEEYGGRCETVAVTHVWEEDGGKLYEHGRAFVCALCTDDTVPDVARCPPAAIPVHPCPPGHAAGAGRRMQQRFAVEAEEFSSGWSVVLFNRQSKATHHRPPCATHTHTHNIDPHACTQHRPPCLRCGP